MKTDKILKCLIAFVMGFLVHYIIRGDGLSIGGDVGNVIDTHR